MKRERVVVLACEGRTEQILVGKLLEDGLLIFEKEEILNEGPLVARQPSDVAYLIATLPLETRIDYYRIGDTLKDKLSYDKVSLRREFITEHRLCTKPEIEVLGAIALGKLGALHRSGMKPKSFFRSLNLGDFADFILRHDPAALLREYRRIKRHEPGEGYLADILKERR